MIKKTLVEEESESSRQLTSDCVLPQVNCSLIETPTKGTLSFLIVAL